MTLAIQTTSGGPTLTNGNVTIKFGQFEKVYNAVAVIQGVTVLGGVGAFVSGMMFQISTTCSGASVNVYVSKAAIGAGAITGLAADAVTADLSGAKVTVIADGQ